MWQKVDDRIDQVKSILDGASISLNFPLIRVAVALNARKTEHWRPGGGEWRSLSVVSGTVYLSDMVREEQNPWRYESFIVGVKIEICVSKVQALVICFVLFCLLRNIKNIKEY